MNMQENILLKDFTTFHTGGPARYFCRVKNVEELKEAVSFAKKENRPFFVLSGGSNLLVSDEGYDGVVIKMDMLGMDFVEEGNEMVSAMAGAGEDWDSFVEATVARGLVGLENLSLVPGLVGAMPVQNVGAYGREVKDTVLEVEAFDTETNEIKQFSHEECRFGYRESFFKTKEGKKYIITRVSFLLQKNGTLKTDYKDVQEYFLKNNISDVKVSDVRNAIIAIRTARLPDIHKVGTAGSFFKNPIVSQKIADELLKKYSDMPIYPSGEGTKKLSAAWILDRVCGLKGAREGNVGTYQNQALVIVNYGGATTKEILKFANLLQEQVKKKTGIELEREIQVL